MAQLTRSNKLFKWAAKALGLLMALGIAGHLLLSYYIETTLEKLVALESKGELQLEIGRASLNYYSRQLSITDFDLQSAAKPDANSTYRFRIKAFNLQLQSLSQFIFHKRLLIDSIQVNAPDVTVELLRPKQNRKEPHSFSYEIGNVYNGIMKALELLHLSRFQIDEGAFHLINRMHPERKNLDFTRIQFIIDNMKLDSTTDDKRGKFLAADSIILRSYHQNLYFPDGQHRIAFSCMRFNSGIRLIELDSCTIHKTDSLGQEELFNLRFDTLKLTNLDFNALYLDNKISADSAYSINPSVDALVKLKKKSREKTDSTDIRETIRNFSETADIRYIGVRNARFNITTRKQDQNSVLKADENNIELFGLKTGPDFTNGYTFDSLKISLRNNEFHTADSFYTVSFDTIEVQRDWIAFRKMKLVTNPNSTASIKREHSISSFALTGIDWGELLFNRKMRANKAILFDPVIRRWSTIRNTPRKKAPVSFAALLGKLQQEIDLEEFEVRNGNLSFEFSPGSGLTLEKANLKLLPNVMLAAEDLAYIQSAVRNLNFRKGEYYNGEMKVQLREGNFDAATRLLQLKKAAWTDPEHNRQLELDGVHIRESYMDPATKNISIQELGWQKGRVHIGASRSSAVRADTSKAAGIGIVSLEKLAAGPTSIELELKGDKTIQALAEQLQASGLSWQAGSQPGFNSIHLTGRDALYKSAGLQASISEFNIENTHTVSLNGISLTRTKDADSMALHLNQLQLDGNLKDLLRKDYTVERLSLEQPELFFRMQRKTDSTSKRNPLPQLQVGQLEVNNLRATGLLTGSEKADTINIQGTGAISNLKLDEKENLNAALVKVSTTPFQLGHPEKLQLRSADPQQFRLSDLSLSLPNVKNSWKFTLDELKTGPVALSRKNPDNSYTRAQISDIHILQLPLAPKALENIPRWLGEHNQWVLDDFDGELQTPSGNIRLFNFRYEAAPAIGRIDSAYYTTTLSREAFADSKDFQVTHLQGKTGTIQIRNIDPVRYAIDSVLHLPLLQIDRPVLWVYRDKTKPFQHGIIRDLPVNMLKAVSKHFVVDTVQVTNGTVNYTEKSEKTKDTGTILLSQLQATMTNLRNVNILPKDSLNLTARFMLMDSAAVRLRFRESYTDTLAGFTLAVRMPKADLRILNKYTIPVISVKLVSGDLDTLNLRAVGREHLSLGLMQLFYRHLKVEFLKNGNEQKKDFTTRLTSFLANKLVIKTNNTRRLGRIYYPRDRERAVFHYWIKIALNGLASSTGTKSNRKLMRKYRRELKRSQLPAIDFD